MALQAFTGGFERFVGSVRMEGSWSGATGDDSPVNLSFQWGYGSFGSSTSSEQSGASSGTYTKTPAVDRDRTLRFRAKARSVSSEVFGASSGDFKSFADAATFGSSLIPGTPTTSTCPVTGSVVPNTLESLGTVYIEYRITGTVLWSQFNPAVLSNISGSSNNVISATLTGLLPGTAYQARFRIDRTTENDTVNYSGIGTFTTQATAITLIAPQTMLGTGQFLTPTLIFGAGAVIIEPPIMGGNASSPLPAQTESGNGAFLVPRFVRSQQNIVEVSLIINGVIAVNVSMS